MNRLVAILWVVGMAAGISLIAASRSTPAPAVELGTTFSLQMTLRGNAYKFECWNSAARIICDEAQK